MSESPTTHESISMTTNTARGGLTYLRKRRKGLAISMDFPGLPSGGRLALGCFLRLGSGVLRLKLGPHCHRYMSVRLAQESAVRLATLA
jgi:hypothetical protein